MTKTQRALGVGRLLISLYGILALASTVRAGYQLARKFEEAPLAYSLSAVSALVYILATIALARRGATWHRIALITITFELVGVLSIGVLSLTHAELFNHSSVWSMFGMGYGFVPLILPIWGLLWLRKTRKYQKAA
ncbi:MAG: hypothetical protein KGL77_07065 [Actinomycetales bacterium]|nr:hypothetical protein [Actinomycetales bacterium]